jgi:hypothetical protein
LSIVAELLHKINMHNSIQFFFFQSQNRITYTIL